MNVGILELLLWTPQLDGTVAILTAASWTVAGRPRVWTSIYTLPTLIRRALHSCVWLHLERQSGGERPVGRDRRSGEGQRHHSCPLLTARSARKYFILHPMSQKTNIQSKMLPGASQDHVLSILYHESLVMITQLLVFVLSDLLKIGQCVDHGSSGVQSLCEPCEFYVVLSKNDLKTVPIWQRCQNMFYAQFTHEWRTNKNLKILIPYVCVLLLYFLTDFIEGFAFWFNSLFPLTMNYCTLKVLW